ncbi:hypothetical protein ACFQ1I_08450 [Kitasatospora arboriphila]
MDDRDTTAHLEWWADPETCPGRVAVRLGAVSTAAERGGARRCSPLPCRRPTGRGSTS